jgi:hypothetical protein
VELGLVFLYQFNGLLLFFGGSKEEDKEHQAGGWNVLAVRRWGKRG